MITPIITPRKPKFVISFIKLTDCGFNDKVFPNKSRPRNNNPKPRIISPKSFILYLFRDLAKKPNPIRGIAKADILNEKPKKETIQAVTVVPIFAPKIIPIAWVNDKICAFTKLTTITVVALDD